VGQFIADLRDFPCNPVTAGLQVHQVMERPEKASQGCTRSGCGRRHLTIVADDEKLACDQKWRRHAKVGLERDHSMRSGSSTAATLCADIKVMHECVHLILGVSKKLEINFSHGKVEGTQVANTLIHKLDLNAAVPFSDDRLAAFQPMLQISHSSRQFPQKLLV